MIRQISALPDSRAAVKVTETSQAAPTPSAADSLGVNLAACLVAIGIPVIGWGYALAYLEV